MKSKGFRRPARGRQTLNHTNTKKGSQYDKYLASTVDSTNQRSRRDYPHDWHSDL